MTGYTIYREIIPEDPRPGMPLGRHIMVDSRSAAYPVAPQSGTPISRDWHRSIDILDQGELGSCTGNASEGALGTAPFYDVVSKAKPDYQFGEQSAVSIYSLATQLDSFAGQYPPTDTGSNGTAAAKACQKLGLIKGYTHASSVDDVITGMQSAAGITGINWYTSFDEPNAEGVVSLPATARVRGGHEIEIAKLDLTRSLVWCPNSWGRNWGHAGWFAIPLDVYDRLFNEGADATFFTPLDQPAPTPVPTPTPTSSVTRTWDNPDDVKLLDTWAAARHVGSNKDAASGWRRGR